MKKKFTLFRLFLFSVCILPAQELSKVSELVDSIKMYYNKSDYHSLYNLLSTDFKNKFPEQDHLSFYQKNIFPAYDKMVSFRYQQNKQGAETYLIKFTKGEMQLSLFIDPYFKIAGMQWLPNDQKEQEASKRKKTYLSDNKRTSTLDTLVDSVVKDHMSSAVSCGLSIGIYSKGSTFYYNYGETRRNTNQVPTKNSIYEIGSITKTFTGLLLAKAVSEKKLSLDDDIRIWIPGNYPDLEFKGNAILVKHLADHTSRIPSVPLDLEKQKEYDPLNPYKNYDRQMILSGLKNFRPDTFPGSKYDYSNMGMSLLGMILEKVYDKPYSELIKGFAETNLMKHSGISTSTEDLKQKCTGYNDSGKETPYWELNDFVAAGGINSCTEDMIAYLKLNLEGKETYIKDSHLNQWGDEKFGIGLGWHIIQTKKGNKMIWHNGGTFGFSSFCGFIKEKECAVIVLSNSGSNVDAIGISLFKFLQEL